MSSVLFVPSVVLFEYFDMHSSKSTSPSGCPVSDLPGPEMRQDPILGSWVIVATERARRPISRERATKEEATASCPFCQGHEGETPPEVWAYREPNTTANAPGWQVRAIPNKYPALCLDAGTSRHDEPYTEIPGVGAHEIIVECPQHVISIGSLSETNIGEVLKAYRTRLCHFRQNPLLAYGMIFKNVGAAAGASLEHSHSQLLAMPVVPTTIAAELDCSLRRLNEQGQCVYCRMIEQELALKERMLIETPSFVAFLPYAGRFPFETWILPRRHGSHFEKIDDSEGRELARVLKRTLVTLEAALDRPPYNYLVHTAPFRIPPLAHYHWHIEILPRLTEIAGFELGTGCYINPVPPEEAARFLRRAMKGDP